MRNLKKLIKKNRLAYLIIRLFYKSIKKMEYGVIKLFCIKLENKVVFSSFKGKSYSDNPKKISEMLHEKYPQIEIVWLFNDITQKKNVVPNYIRMVKNDTLRARYELYTAKCWIDNFPKEAYEIKTKKQLYIHTSHGDRPIKRFALDKEEKHGKPVEMLETKKCDLFLVGSDMGEKVARSAFRYEGELLKKGLPRNDVLLDKKEVGEKDFRILLYAPTFRDENKGKKQNVIGVNLEEVIDFLNKKTGDKWKCYVRGHSAVKGIGGLDYNQNIIDVSSYEDMADLMKISDILITDYSSCAGDFIIQNKPVILFQPDYVDYLEKDRELYFKQEELPYWTVNNRDELFAVLDEMNEQAIEENCKAVQRFYGIYESGASAEAVVDYIYGFINK